MKRIISIVFTALILTSACAPQQVVAEQQMKLDIVSDISINGERQKIPGYNIDGNNYYHLRSLAIAMIDTAGRFRISEVGDDFVKLESGYNYIDGAIKYYAPTITEDDIITNEKHIIINDVDCKITAYIIEGSTYISIKDLSAEMGYELNYNAKINTVEIITENSICSYIRDDVYNPQFSYYPFDNIDLNLNDINKILSHSYISGYGEYFYRMQNTYNINVVYALAVAYVESGRGSKPCGSYNYFGMLGCNYSSPQSGINAFGELMNKKLYYGKTIEQIAPIYCDNQWAGLVKNMMREIWSYI